MVTLSHEHIVTSSPFLLQCKSKSSSNTHRTSYVYGLSVGDVGDSTLSDRLVLGEGGFIAITIAIDATTGKSVSTPEVNGRGFSDDPAALKEAAQLVEAELVRLAGEGITDSHRIAQAVRRLVGRWVADKYRRRPMIVPTVLEVN